MIAYIYFNNSNIISYKIDNVENISDTDREIKGENDFCVYGESQNYIILENDTINKNTGDIINIDNLVDHRKYFIDKDAWYQEQIKNQNDTIVNQISTISNLDSLLKTTNETIEGFMNFYFEQNPDQA